MMRRYIAKVVKIINAHTVVINIGTEQNVQSDSRFTIVGLGEDITDPDTGEVIEKLELFRGRARVLHAQGKLATLINAEVFPGKPESNELRAGSPLGAGFRGVQLITALREQQFPEIRHGEPKPFTGIKIGDSVIKNS